MPKARTQRMTRRSSILLDQFGRKYNVTVEISTGDPCGLIGLSGWGDPLEMPMKYLRIPRDADNEPLHGRIDAGFAQWIKDQTVAQLEWKKILWTIGRRQLKHAFDAKTAEQDEVLLDLVGPRPFPTVEVLKMAQAGDRVLLGFEPLNRYYRVLLNRPSDADLLGETEDAEKPETYTEFVSRKCGEGFDLKQISPLWKAEKEARAELVEV